MVFEFITDLFLFPMSQAAYLAIIFLGWLAVLVGIGLVIFFHIKARKKVQPISNQLKYNTISIVLIFFDMLYTILNFGWCRYGLAIFYMLQSIILIVGSNISAQYISKVRLINPLLRLNYILYIVPRIVLPDTLANDLSGFCGLIKYSEFWGHTISDVSLILSIVSILLLIVQIAITLRLKKRGI